MNKEQIRKFRRGAAMLIDAPDGYEWGKESIDGADCSGVVCHGLICAGFNIRCTADEIYNQLVMEESYKTVRNDFYQGMYVIMLLEGNADPSQFDFEGELFKCTHIAPFISPDVVVNANYGSDAIEAMTVIQFINKYKCVGAQIKFGKIREIQVHYHSGKLFYGADKLLDEGGINYDRI